MKLGGGKNDPTKTPRGLGSGAAWRWVVNESYFLAAMVYGSGKEE
jgi:hypothetical protein